MESEDKEKRDVMRKNLAENNIYPIWVKSKNKNTSTTQITFPAANIHYNNKSMSVNLFYENYFYNNSEQDTYTIEQYDIQQSINKLEYNFIKSIHKIWEDNQKHIAFLSGNGELDSTNTFDIRNTLSEFYSVEYFDISMYETDSVSGNLNIQNQIVWISVPNFEFDYIRISISYFSTDINQDGIWNVLDVVLVINYIFELITLTEEQLIYADLNQDEIINVLDIVEIVNIILQN